jgi:formate hydrogenlyase transcriptional activator
MAEKTGKTQKIVADLESRLREAENTLRAIRAGEVDALVVHTADGDRVFTLKARIPPTVC